MFTVKPLERSQPETASISCGAGPYNLAELIRRQPFVEIRRSGIVLLIDKIPQRLFPLRAALQLQKHVRQRKRIRQLPAVVFRVRFTARVAGQRV